eukprot:TRINITY_DN27916_c3_g1_i2.p1 TRINITY_DN27916_c3_g1~~TRINITY_DN27916_c3_g1_i2.p1  ORF type:complete len:992 (+),score=318.18 TRINITY_DN27916_c3_g1_i2:445-2976(+)
MADENLEDVDRDEVQKIPGDDDVPSMDWEITGNDGATSELTDLIAKVTGLEADVQQAMETSQVVLTKKSDPKGAELCLGVMKEHLESVRKAQQELTQQLSAAKRTSEMLGDDMLDDGSMRALGVRLRSLKARLLQEITVAKRQTAKLQQKAKHEWDAKAVEAALPLAETAVYEAQDAVEGVALQAGDLNWRRTQMETAMKYGDQFGEDIEKALDATQEAAEKAQEAVDAAKARLDSLFLGLGALPSEARRKEVAGEIADLRKTIEESQRKLWPFMEVRAEFDMQIQAVEEIRGISSRIELLEKKVAKVCETLSSSLVTEDNAQAADLAVDPIKVDLTKLLTELKKRVSAASGGQSAILREKLVELQERGVAASRQLAEIKARASQKRQQIAGHALLHRAQEVAEKVETWLSIIAEAQRPWTNEEVLPEAEAEKALASAADCTSKAEAEVKSAQAMLHEHFVEVRRLPEGGPVRLSTTDAIKALQVRIDAVALKAAELKVDTFARRTKLQMAEVVCAVREAENEVKKIREVAKPLGEDNLESSKPGHFKKAAEEIQRLKEEISKSCTKARAVVERYQADPKGKESPSFQTQLGKLAHRLEAVEAELNGCCQASREVDSNRDLVKAKRSELKKLEEIIDELEMQLMPMGDEEPAMEAELVTFTRLWKTETELLDWISHVQVLQKNPHGALRFVANRLLSDGNSLAARLSEVKDTDKPRCEKGLCLVFKKLAAPEAEKCEVAMQEAEAAEGPFLKGLEDVPSALALKTVSLCEAAAEKAQKVLDKANCFFERSRKEVAAISDDDVESRPVLQLLSDSFGRVQRVGRKLQSYQEEAKARRRAAENAS